MEGEIGQRPITENLFKVFHVPCTASTFKLPFLCWTHRFDSVGVYKMTCSAAAGGMSYTVKLACQAYLGFVSQA